MARSRPALTLPLVVDTMVVAYALLGVPAYRDECLDVLASDRDFIAPDVFRAELVNVIWQWSKKNAIALDVAVEILGDAEALITQVVAADLLWARALELSIAHDHTAYDTLFVSLAEAEGTKLLTYDRKLALKFPEIAILPGKI